MVIKLTITLFILSFPIAASSEPPLWYLMSRHGQCAEIRILQRKVSDLGDVNTPEQFISLLKSQGYDVSSTEVPQLNGSAIQVDVPAKDLAVVFVKKEMCKDFIKK